MVTELGKWNGKGHLERKEGRKLGEMCWQSTLEINWEPNIEKMNFQYSIFSGCPPTTLGPSTMKYWVGFIQHIFFSGCSIQQYIGAINVLFECNSCCVWNGTQSLTTASCMSRKRYHLPRMKIFTRKSSEALQVASQCDIREQSPIR